MEKKRADFGSLSLKSRCALEMFLAASLCFVATAHPHLLAFKRSTQEVMFVSETAFPAVPHRGFSAGEQEVGRDLVAQMVSRGVPVLDEREGRKSPEVQLTALCSWATVPVVASVACTFARGVTYACLPAGEAPVGLAPSTNSGNYFEVTVMNPGEKTTIGIGLADPDVFPATKQMPGWVDHSYGYHGDDGRKFGRGKTESIWPTWVDGDVIGCGFDPIRGSIW